MASFISSFTLYHAYIWHTYPEAFYFYQPLQPSLIFFFLISVVGATCSQLEDNSRAKESLEPVVQATQLCMHASCKWERNWLEDIIVIVV